VIEVNAEGDASYPACLPKLTDGFFNASADSCLPMMGWQWQECANSGRSPDGLANDAAWPDRK
jgi:hypothetical protein